MKKYNDSEREFFAQKWFDLVETTANLFDVTDSDRDELISAGYLGFTKALNTFDKTMDGSKFEYYAYTCIKNEIRQSLRSMTRIRDYEKIHIESFPCGVYADERYETSELRDVLMIADPTMDNIIGNENIQDLMRAVVNLKPLYRKVMTLRLGLDGRDPMRQIAVATTLGVSQAYVSKIEKDAFSHLLKIESLQSI